MSEPTSPSALDARLKLARLVAALIALVAIVALAVMALSTKTEKVALVKPLGSQSAPRELLRPSTPAVPGPLTVAVPEPVVGEAVSATAAAQAPSTGAAPTPSPLTTSPGPDTTLTPAGAVCPFPLPAPGQTGGLASLVGIVPVFGPFSAEAFAFSPAYEPLLKLFGPFLPAFEQGLATADPATAPVIAALRTLEDAGYGAVGPLYGPYRQQILDAEKQAATAIGVYTSMLADSAPAACVIALEGLVAP